MPRPFLAIKEGMSSQIEKYLLNTGCGSKLWPGNENVNTNRAF